MGKKEGSWVSLTSGGNTSSSDYEAWQRIAMLAGWSDWELGIKKSKSKQKPKKKKATTTWKR